MVVFLRGEKLGEMLMRTFLLATIAALFTFVAFGAQAMPVAKLKGITAASDQVTPVRDGCGRWMHRGPHGHCRHN
jgi:hypothetical protein